MAESNGHSNRSEYFSSNGPIGHESNDDESDNSRPNGKKNKYKIRILSDRGTDLTKINPRMWWEQISEYIHLTYNRNLDEMMDQGTDQMDPFTVYHIKGDVIWALGPKAKNEIMRVQWGRELTDVDLSELLLKPFKKTFIPARDVFHSRDEFFNIKQEDNETLDEYWKRIVDIEKKCEFNRITKKKIITYKFAATINDEKAPNKFIKGPLKLQMVLETIEQDNYNRKYRDKKPNKKLRKLPSDSSSSEEQVAYTHPARKRKITEIGKKKLSNRNCHVCGKPNWSFEHICPARRAQCNNCNKMGHFAKVCKSKAVSRIQKEPSTDSNTGSWPEIDHVQSVNGINRVDFYKAILLVQGQPIKIIFDTGSPVTIIPPIISPIEIHKTTKCFVDVNKNPRKIKGEAMLEMKTGKSKEVLPMLITENKNTQPLLGLD